MLNERVEMLKKAYYEESTVVPAGILGGMLAAGHAVGRYGLGSGLSKKEALAKAARNIAYGYTVGSAGGAIKDQLMR